MSDVRINVVQLMQDLRPALINQRKGLSYGAALSKFKSAYNDLMEKFEESAITNEIEEAESGDPLSVDNKSGLLGGKGNLFTFFGFNEGRTPIADLRQMLEEIEMEDDCAYTGSYREGDMYAVIYGWSVNGPTEDELVEATPMDWESGNSWLEGIQDGVSGLSNYIYWLARGRSGGGAQAKNELRKLEMTPQEDYLLKWIRRFYERLDKGV